MVEERGLGLAQHRLDRFSVVEHVGHLSEQGPLVRGSGGAEKGRRSGQVVDHRKGVECRPGEQIGRAGQELARHPG